nr:phage tail tape measure protein [uncultured Trichococcus sp.]
MIDIYNNNFGESFEDIGVAMAEVAKQTGLADEELQWATESALLMRDAFGFEVADSVRAASMMMDQFGVSGDTAYDLIAQGAQKGLDKNGDLLDTINEYSGQFSGMGFSAEEMFNMLLNGAESGTFSVDKLGDAVKEFSIRTKDGSDTSREAFDTLGLNADEMFANFAAGGETGKAAFELVNERLMGMTDPLEQNRLGVALYGTQWEDLGATGVQALTNVDGSIQQTSENLSLMDLNETKYNTFGEALEGVGRQLQTGILLPISEKLLPKLAELTDSFAEKMPQIQGYVETGIAVAVDVFNGFKDALQWTTDNANILIPVIAGLAAGYVALQIIGTVNTLIAAGRGLMAAYTAITGTSTITMAGLNAVMAANPMGALALAIGLLIAAGVALYMNWDTVKETAGNLWSTISNVFGKIGSIISEKMDAAKKAVGNAIDAIKGFFSFDISWPHIPVPSFSVSPSGWKIGDLLKGSIPSLGISWNADGGVFTRPTIFDTASGLQGVGEAGPEAILPLNDKTYEGMARGIVKALGGRETIDYGMMADAILQALISYGFKIEVDKRQFGRLVTEVYEV